MMSPTTEGPSCDCTYQSDPWCVCTDRESGADYESADSPHFLPSDLLEVLCWADWWTAVGVGLSSERLAGDNHFALSMVALLKTALFGFTLRWKDPPVILLFCAVLADLPLSPLSYLEPGHNYITPSLCSLCLFVCLKYAVSYNELLIELLSTNKFLQKIPSFHFFCFSYKLYRQPDTTCRVLMKHPPIAVQLYINSKCVSGLTLDWYLWLVRTH